MTMTPLTLASTDTLRNAQLDEIVALLTSQADIRYDVVVNAMALAYDQGMLTVDGGAMRFDEDGASPATAILRVTQGCERQVAERLGIPTKYMSAMRDDAIVQYERAAKQVDQLEAQHVPGLDVDRITAQHNAAALLDHNVNHWLKQDPNRKFLLRAFRTDNPDEIGVARAFLSDRFGMIDHLDVLVAALDGVRQSGAEVEIDGCDLSEKRMQVRVSAPSVAALAPTLLKGYRNPFREGGLVRASAEVGPVARERRHGGYGEEDDPIVFAGFVIENSETGGGAFLIVPRVIVQICRNGMTIKADALREVHLGGKLDAGIIRWSDSTQRKAIDLITAKAKDAVATFLDASYIEQLVERLEEKAGAPVKDPTTVVERVAKQFGFTQNEQDSILAAFIVSGQNTAGGVLQAVTAAAQTIDDPDRAADLEASAIDVMEYVAR